MIILNMTDNFLRNSRGAQRFVGFSCADWLGRRAPVTWRELRLDVAVACTWAIYHCEHVFVKHNAKPIKDCVNQFHNHAQ